VLKAGGRAAFTFFCLEDLDALGLLGRRWTFAHNLGAAAVENLRHPESAVAYARAWIEEAAKQAGFAACESRPGVQTMFVMTTGSGSEPASGV
jgi:hypothetical protein